jgi:hypothetical protein
VSLRNRTPGEVVLPKAQGLTNPDAKIAILEHTIQQLADRLRDLELACFRDTVLCPRCKGKGEVGKAYYPRDYDEIYGKWTGRDVCPTCGGLGRVRREPVETLLKHDVGGTENGDDA